MKSSIKKGAKFLLYKILFPLCYHLGALRKRKEKAVFIELQGLELSSNFKEIWNELEKAHRDITNQEQSIVPVVFFLKYKKNDLGYYGRCFRLLWEISDAAYLFLNDSCNVLGAFKLRKGSKLIQLWHACGAFKKWGFSIADAEYGESREEMIKYPYHKNYTFVTVSSKTVAWAYAEAFGIPIEKIEPLGISRTDRYFDSEFIEKTKQRFFQRYPKGKKVILYAPTFRKERINAESPVELDYELLYRELGTEYLFIEKRHPFVRSSLVPPKGLEDFVFCEEEFSVEELLCVADLLITDYSSVMFDYSLFERPILFFAYDLNQYYDERGFYYNYKEFVPGRIVSTTKEAAEEIHQLQEDETIRQEAIEKVKKFRQSFMASCDGNATKRIISEMTKG